MQPTSRPGMSPAMKSAPTDAPVIMENMIIGIDGGMTMPMVELATVIPLLFL